jgi:hypothetical protein
MLVGFCIESVKGTHEDTPPLPPTTSLQEDPSPQLYRGRSEGSSTTDEEKPQLSSRSPSPDYTVGTRGRSTPWRDGPIHNLLEDHNILGSLRRPFPTPKGFEVRPPSSPRRSTPSVVRPLLQGSPHSKYHPSPVYPNFNHRNYTKRRSFLFVVAASKAVTFSKRPSKGRCM